MIRTDRLLLRAWTEADRAPFASINMDPRVMEFMPKCLSRAESDAFADRIEAHFKEHGFGLWAAESAGQFIGYVGLSQPGFMPGVEIGSRLGFDYWGNGLATEGARAVVRHAFETLGLRELVSFTVPANVRSRRVTEKIGMTLSEEFDHPGLPAGYPLSRHVLYRLRAETLFWPLINVNEPENRVD